MGEFTLTQDCRDALERARAHAPFLAMQLGRYPDVETRLANSDVEGALALAHAAGDGAESVGQGLRRKRGALALVTAVADLAGAWDLGQVITTLSAFADQALDEAIAAAFAERFPGEPVRGFAVIALGKHGSRELNYSSDIDPILIFDPTVLPHRAKEEPVESAVRIGRRVTELLSARDADGYVFRVDLRLRPSPEATPIALPVEAAIGYYESAALGWEQAAFIRARACAGDMALGDYFLRSIRPFIWRRSLDYGAIAGITDITRRIRDHYAQGQALGPNYDLKRGRGGIREVEFFAQVHQLIHGGRNPALRAPATRDALAALAAADVIAPDIAADLSSAYTLFRTLEHRLQMVDDRQTHSLPAQPDSLDNVARLHGLNDGDALIGLLRGPVERVGAIYGTLSADEGGEGLSSEPEMLVEQLRARGLAAAEQAADRIGRWRDGSARALRSDAARAALERVLPALVDGIARAPDPARAFIRLDDVIHRLPAAINFFKLLEARPGLVEILGTVLSHAPTLAEELARRTELLEGLIDASAFDPPPLVTDLVREFGLLEAGDDYQILLDRVRQKVADRRFALGVQIVSGRGDPVEAGAGYARVAEAALVTLADATVAEFEAQHGRVPGGELVVLALGRLGGAMLTHASDLDLIYLFTGDFAAESDGPRPLGATQYFNRLAQRLGNALSVPTASGPLYEVDTRLRPSGPQGLLAVSLDSFARYQREAAWAWEHLALTRARPVYGSADARAAVDAIIADTLRAPRDRDDLAKAAVRMRRDIARHKPPAGPLDVKLAEGGLVDLEFLIHITQFRTGEGFYPQLEQALGALVAGGHLPPDLIEAERLLTRYLVVSRLVAPAGGEPDPSAHPLVAQACGAADWPSLLASLDAARQSVRDRWRALADLYPEDEHAD